MNKLPADFVERISNQFSNYKIILDALNDVPPSSVRVNAFKANKLNITDSVAWSLNGYYLASRPEFTLDPDFHAGAYYPQEAGSMYVEKALTHLEFPEEPLFLDLCAAPGGKSTILLDFLQGKGTLISNDISKQRAQVLEENLTKWGYANCIVTSNQPKSFLKARVYYDLILVDAPCSGEGMFRKDHRSRDHWSLSNCSLSSKRQSEILEIADQLLNEKGYLIYSTCTFNPEENELQLESFLKKHEYEVIEPDPSFPWLIDNKKFGVQFIPGLTTSEGFYCAILRKKRKTEPIKSKKTKNLILSQITPDGISVNPLYSSTLFFNSSKEQIRASNKSTFEMHKLLLETHFVLKYGTLIFDLSFHSTKPYHDLAMSHQLNWEGSIIDLTIEESLDYLRKQTFPLQAGKGFHLVRHTQNPLGFIKHTGDRFNNLYPAEWRIRNK